MKAYLGIGTNIGNRMENLQNAVYALNLLPLTKVTQISNVYETDPVGYSDQNDFLNIVVEIETQFNSDSLLGAILGIEAGLGRIRVIKNGPRVIDIDLLLYGDEYKNTETLVLPHPRMMERGFVLIPLSDINFKNKFIEKKDIKKEAFEGVRFYCSKDELKID
ncbi:MAG: 2-amino-4-hydroxy-6-hydroxymethyldihydropteridine diphosphokinase [Clostridia bacterium]|nr:2-amino-4-hydroxy-6-hydroxymethyldihydropteridine diphosphokinase [Clostridia bacterium]